MTTFDLWLFRVTAVLFILNVGWALVSQTVILLLNLQRQNAQLRQYVQQQQQAPPVTVTP